MNPAKFINRHVRPPADLTAGELVTWRLAKGLLHEIGAYSADDGKGCRASQSTLGESIAVSRQRVNELVQFLIRCGHLDKEVNSRRYVIVGIAEHDPLRCGDKLCRAEAQRDALANRRARRPQHQRRPVGLAAAMLDAADVVEADRFAIDYAERLRREDAEREHAARVDRVATQIAAQRQSS